MRRALLAADSARALRGERRAQMVQAVAALLGRDGPAAAGVRPAAVAQATNVARHLVGTLLSIYAARGFIHGAGPRNDKRYFLCRDAADAYARSLGSERVVVKAPLRQVLCADAPVQVLAAGVKLTVAPVRPDPRYHVPASFVGEFTAEWRARRAGGG